VNNDPHKILLIQTAFIGDVIFTTPLIRAVKQRFPEAHLTVMVAPRAEFVLRNNPHVDELLILDKRGKDHSLGAVISRMRELKARKFDLVVSPHRSWRSAFLAWGSGAKKKVGFRRGLGRWIYSPSVPYGVKKEPRYVERKLNLIRALGVTPDSNRVEMFVSAEDRAHVEQNIETEKLSGKPLAAFNPGSQWETKRWILEYYLELGSKLGRESGFQVVLLGSPQEKGMLDWLESRMEPKPLNRVGDSLGMAAAWLEKCTVYVGGDTGPTYMAVAVGTKHVIALYGPTPENVFDFRDGDAVIVKEGLICHPCSPHGPRVCPVGTLQCQTGIWVGRVFDAIEARIRI
jgi:heptosyltransferase-2